MLANRHRFVTTTSRPLPLLPPRLSDGVAVALSAASNRSKYRFQSRGGTPADPIVKAEALMPEDPLAIAAP